MFIPQQCPQPDHQRRNTPSKNDISYSIKVNAGQVLAQRFKRYDPSLKPKPSRRNGWFNLYYAILGDIDDYNIKSAKRRVQIRL